MHFTSHSGASSDDGHDEFIDAWRRRARPENEIPVAVETTILLGRTDELGVAISGMRVYRNGVEFTVSARCRGQLARRGTLLEGLSGAGHPWHGDPVEPFLLGFELSDGRSATNVGHWPSHRPDFDNGDGPWLTPSGGGGSERSADHDFFLSPLPPGDTFTLIAAWPGFGIAENRHVLDAAMLRAAAERVIELWPAEPDHSEPEPPPPPVMPSGSWFDRN